MKENLSSLTNPRKKPPNTRNQRRKEDKPKYAFLIYLNKNQLTLGHRNANKGGEQL
jgi:hypothetical protein